MVELHGRRVMINDANIEKALRKFKKKVLASGVLNELRKREAYEKPTTRKKRARNAAKNRWKKYLDSQRLPQSYF